MEKNVPMAPTCQGGLLPVIGARVEAEEKGIEELKDGASTRTSPSDVTLPQSPPPAPIPSSHIAPILPPHLGPTPSMSAPFLNHSGSPV